MARGNKLANGLTARQQKFVASVLQGRNGSVAAIEAGYSRNGAKNTATRLCKRKGVAAALQAGQLAVQSAAEVTAVSMIKQCDEDREFAMSNRNAMAACKSSELKAKLAGLLIDKIESKSLGVVINVQKFGDHD
jgi:phage terminase small subunit